MRIFILSFFLFLAVFPSFSQDGFQIKGDKCKVTIPFKLINNLIFVPIKLNGEELTFLLDTGVEETVLFSLNVDSEVELNNIEVIKLKDLGDSESIDGYKSSHNELSVKQFFDKDHIVYIVLDQEFNFSSHVGIPVNGIIGYHFFKNHFIQIDYQKKHLIIFNNKYMKKEKLIKRYRKDSISLELRKPYLYENISSKGVKKHSKLLIDTGNSDAVWIFNHEKAEVPLPDIFLEDFLGRGFNGNVYGKRARIDYVEFGGHNFENALTNFADSTSTKSVTFVNNRVGSIGGEILSRFNLFFDYRNNAIYTQPNKKIDDLFNFNMSGIEVEHAGLEWIKEVENKSSDGISIFIDSDGKNAYNNQGRKENNAQFRLIPIFKIFSVRQNSEAEKAGLKKGDRILKIDGRSVERFTIQKIHELLRSEEGRVVEMVIERNGMERLIRFKLKKIL